MRSMNPPEENRPPVYAIRFAGDVPMEIQQEYERLAEISGTEIADDWQDKLMAAVRSLATYPERCALAAEDEHFQHIHPGLSLRILIYRRTRSGPAWRILMTVHEANALDPPIVYIRHIWHGARAPITFWPLENE